MTTPAPMKQRVRLYAAGQAMYRLVTPDRGYGGAYGQTRRPAKWACIECGKTVYGTDEAPWVVLNRWSGAWGHVCARNGHAPCAHCGKALPRLDDGCPRAHPWVQCPAKTEASRMIPQHSAAGHVERVKP